jgi:hypothetical protein
MTSSQLFIAALPQGIIPEDGQHHLCLMRMVLDWLGLILLLFSVISVGANSFARFTCVDLTHL